MPQLYDENGRPIGQMPQSQQSPNGILKFLGDIFSPVDRTLRGVSELTSKATNASGGNSVTNFLSKAEKKKYKEDPMNIIKDIASSAAFLVPGGGIKSAIGAGALSGFGSTYGNSDLGSTITGTLTGAGTAGALGLAGKGISKLASGEAKLPQFLQGAGKKLNQFADNQEVGAVQRSLGNVKVPTKLGGQPLIKEIKRLGFDTNDPEALISSADNFLKQNGGVIKDRVTQIAANGGKGVNIADVIAPLEAKLAKTNSATLRKPLQEAINEIKAVGGKSGIIPEDKFYALKQELGDLGKFNPMADPAATSKAGAFQTAYRKSNKILDDIFIAAGYDDLSSINKDLTSAIRAKNYGEIATSRAMPSRPVNLLDAVTAAGGMAAGGPLGFATSMVGSKVLQSPKTEAALIKAARGVGGALENSRLPQLGGNNVAKFGELMQNPRLSAILGPILQSSAQVAPAFAGDPSSEGVAMYDQTAPVDTSANDIATQLYNSGMKISDIKALQDVGIIPKPKTDTATKLTEGEKKFKAAGQQAEAALRILESGQASTGKLAGIGNFFGEQFGTQSAAQTDYKSKLASARGSAVSALSGANVPPSEYARIAAMIPEETDEPQVASQKLKSFIEAMVVLALL